MQIPAIIQARMGSSRCPKKTLKKIQNKHVIQIVINRLYKCKNISEIIVAIPKTKKDVELKKYLKKKKIKYFSGTENDLIGRFVKTINFFKLSNCKYFLRVTADNVFIDHEEVDRIIQYATKRKLIFCSHVNSTYEERNNDFSGEVYNIASLKKIDKKKLSLFDREHVYPYFFNLKSNKIKRLEVKNKLKTKLKFDLDFKEDLFFFQKIGKNLKRSIYDVSTVDIIKAGSKIKNV
jgi:spore coat polysaccharide biosynthesis protein SpsF (cytidylyltransferase family)